MKALLQLLKLFTYIERYSTLRPMLLLALCLSIGAASCNRDSISKDGDKSDIIRMNMYAEPTLIGEALIRENNVSQIKALVYVYDGNNYVFDYSATIDNISYRKTGYTYFSLNLFGEKKPVKITIIANADDAVSEANPLFGETEAAIKQRINKAFTSNGISENLPMWAEFLFPNGINSSLKDIVFGAKALRAMARIDIDASSTTSIFEMTSIRVYRANSLMQLIPDDFTTNPLKVDAPSIPTQSLPNINTIPIFVSQNISTSQLYVPESVAPNVNDQVAVATCVVVGGKYGGSSDTTYYRLDFNPPVSGYPLGQILRNHQYTFNITNVNGPGWSTPDDAANNVSSHIITSVLDWTDNYININIGGSDYFFIPHRSVNLLGQINSVSTIAISTDIQNCVLYWSDALGNPTDNYTGESIVNYYFSATISSTDIEIQALDYNDFGNGAREQYFTVAAGRLRIPIKITQEENPFVHQSLWSQFNVDQFGTFTTSINDFGQLYVFGNSTPFPNTGVVSNWPTGTPSATWTVQNDPCPTGWRMPRSAELNDLSRDYPARRAYNGTDPANPNSGIWVAPTQTAADNATFANPGTALFFPFAGIRNSAQNGTAANAIGVYWSNHTDGNWRALTASFSGNTQNNSLIDIRTSIIGYSVRCIRDL